MVSWPADGSWPPIPPRHGRFTSNAFAILFAEVILSRMHARSVDRTQKRQKKEARSAGRTDARSDAGSQGQRRSFLRRAVQGLFGTPLAIGITSLVASLAMWLLGCLRFMFPNVLIEPPTTFKVGFPGDYSAGQVETRYKAQHGVWVVRHSYEGQARIYVLNAMCTHLGCTPNWLETEQKFKCPCHGSGFYKSGIHFEGPAPRPLERYAIRIVEDGQMEVDKSRTFQEELGEWDDPDCFVSV